MKDMFCLAEGYVVPKDQAETGLNANVMIAGPTGCGKTFSNNYGGLCHTTNSSLVVALSKRSIKKRFKRLFKKRGYKVLDLNFVNPEEGNVGYEMLHNIKTIEDATQVAKNVVYATLCTANTRPSDQYWNESAVSELAGIIYLEILNAGSEGRKPSIINVIELYKALKIHGEDRAARTNLDALFEEAERLYPGNPASQMWRTVSVNAFTTASCVLSTLNTVVDKLFTDRMITLSKMENKVSFEKLGQEKTILFITTSPMNRTMDNLMNVMYGDMFRVLFESAEKNPEGCLEVPVHIICDDFACSGKINGFEDYISIFRAAGISVSLLIQSETQLESMYGKAAAATIINNCDTYVFYPGMDIMTCRNAAARLNVQLSTITKMPLEQVVVFRRGSAPVVARRYQILDDPVYKELMDEKEEAREEQEVRETINDR